MYSRAGKGAAARTGRNRYMRMVSIASGSSGNCIYIGSDHTHLLVDAGISNKRIQEGLNDIGLTGSDVTGILVTHEHSDISRDWEFFPENIIFPFTGQKKLWMRSQPARLWELLIPAFYPRLSQMWIFRWGSDGKAF